MSETRHGGCLCGAVRYAVFGPMRPVIACHCEQCRRISGHFVAATACRPKGLSVSGKVRWYRSSATARRGFCPTCGASLFWQADDPPRISIHAGTLDQPSGLKLAAHIHVASKGDYYQIADALPCADGDDPVQTEWLRP